MNKRLIPLLAILALLLPLLAACGGDGGDQPQVGEPTIEIPGATPGEGGGAAPTEPVEEEPAATEPVEGGEATAPMGGAEGTETAGGGDIQGTGQPQEGEGGPVTFFGGWGADEGKNFQQVLKWCDENYGTQATYQQASGDLLAELSTRVQGGNPPDLASVSTPSSVQQFVQGGALQPLDFLPQEQLNANFAEFWLNAGTVEDTLYAVPFKSDNKALVWYSPKKFQEGGYEPPKTYDEMVQLSEKMVADGKKPWAFGAADAWTLTDWFENTYLRVAGPEKYDQLVNHEIPWTDESVKQTFQEMNRIIGNDEFIAGGRASALGQRWDQAAVEAITGDAMMFQEASFVGASMNQNLPEAQAGEDFDFFPFPAIGDAQGPTPVVVGPNMVIMLTDKPGAKALMRCLIDPRSARPWAEAGGFLSPNKNVPESAYPNDIVRRQAQMLTEAGDADVLRMDGSDLMPPEFGSDYLFTALQNYFKNPKGIENMLPQFEAQAKRAYRNR